MQRERNEIFAAERIKCDEDRHALFCAIAAMAQPSIALNEKSLIFERTHIGKRTQVSSHLGSNAFGEASIVWLENGPSRGLVDRVDYL